MSAVTLIAKIGQLHREVGFSHPNVPAAILHAAELRRAKDVHRPMRIQNVKGIVLVTKPALMKHIDAILQPKTAPPKEKNFRLITSLTSNGHHLDTWHATLDDALKAMTCMYQSGHSKPVRLFNPDGERACPDDHLLPIANSRILQARVQNNTGFQDLIDEYGAW